ncbi:DUF222 domain-containing protein [Microbacterium sp.]|uniref:HNH endonuclease n=1 Tax=Microbacterium sp. TaxID=51671 RepID=UPI003C7565D8
MGNDTLTGIQAALDALRDVSGGRASSSLTPGELVAANEAVGVLRRQVDAVCAELSAEISRQSRTELGKDSLSRALGFRTPEAMISAATGVPVPEAKRMVHVGEATAPRTSLTGEPLPEKHPHVAAAFRAGRIGTAAADAIVAMLDKVALRADTAAADAMEAQLADAAPGLRPDELAKLIVRAETYLDPDGVEDKLAEARADRALTISERDGVLRVEFRSDVLSAAPVRAAIEGIVTATLNAGRDRPDDETDQRSIRQLRADALIELCDHAIGCEATPTRPTTTVVVRMTLDQLTDGVGTATIDGTDQPIPAGQVRRLAANLEIIPVVLGGDSEILDLGRAARLFTKPQKHAITERDGGCVGCGAPPGRCHVHHLTWWSHGGRTDLANGVLLCSACHHRLHDDGWDIHIDGPGIQARVWMIPPAWIDPHRRPRPAGRHRHDLAAA